MSVRRGHLPVYGYARAQPAAKANHAVGDAVTATWAAGGIGVDASLKKVVLCIP